MVSLITFCSNCTSNFVLKLLMARFYNSHINQPSLVLLFWRREVTFQNLHVAPPTCELGLGLVMKVRGNWIQVSSYPTCKLIVKLITDNSCMPCLGLFRYNLKAQRGLTLQIGGNLLPPSSNHSEMYITWCTLDILFNPTACLIVYCITWTVNRVKFSVSMLSSTLITAMKQRVYTWIQSSDLQNVK
jgi:hypothetical protein